MMEQTRVLGLDDQDSASDEGLPPNTLLHNYNYVVDRVLGHGGFGITYFARDMQLERSVVIKECFPESICDRQGLNVGVRSPDHEPHFRKCVDMFIREARSIAQLSHPNIVNVYAIFEENQTAYMVLDLIEGSDLLDVIEVQDNKLAPDHVQAILSETLSALTAVHDKNLLHRDISPDNILLDQKGRPILIDFGSAREFASERATEKTTLLFVKDGYSPFEFYVSGAAHSPASDLYALGGTFYHLIAGEAPPSSQFRHAEQQAGNPDPCEPLAGRFPGYDPVFLEAIDKSLSLVPSERIQSTRDWLKFLTDNDVSQVRPKEAAPRRSLPGLGDLVSETNKQVLGDDQVVQPEPLRLETPVPDLGHQPKWRDEFNSETEEWPENDGFSVQDWGPETRTATASEESRMQDDAIIGSAQEPIAAYYQYKDDRKSRRGSSRNLGATYSLVGFLAVVLVLFIVLKQQGAQEDASWAAEFSPEDFCRGDFFQTYFPVSVDCERRNDVREIDMEDRERILELDKSDQIR